MIDYPEYYERCKSKYSADNKISRDASKEEAFYKDPVRQYDLSSISESYNTAVKSLAQKVKHDLDNDIDVKDDGIMPKHYNMWKFSSEIDTICNILVPKLEEDMFLCNLYVDKIYIYRTSPVKERTSSYIWHYDNNPNEVVKTLIYLSDVKDDRNSPYEYFVNPEGSGILGKSTRTGGSVWYVPANNSRVNKEVDSLMSQDKGYSTKKVFGPQGTTCSFVNNAVHRANPVIEGYRDVINIRVKPTLEPVEKFADPRWTSGFETSGVVDRNPENAWNKLV